MAINVPTYLLNATLVAARALEVPAASFSNGGNQAGSCANGIGIATAFYNPKEQDWPRIADTTPRVSRHIGAATSVINVIEGVDINNRVAFVTADAATAPNAVLDVATGAVNRTGVTVPIGAWVWGVIPVA